MLCLFDVFVYGKLVTQKSNMINIRKLSLAK